MNVLVTGAKGQLGRCVADAQKNADDRYLYTDVDELDISDAAALERFVADNNIDVIINCAAYTNVDKAEEPEELPLVEKVNVDAVRNLADVAKRHNALLVHISTDYVFGGNLNNTPCNEEQKPNPTGVYGLTKLKGEQEIELRGGSYLIFRTAWLYSEYGRNFVKTMLRLTAEKESLSVVFDQCGTPTYARDLAEAIIDIINKRDFEGKTGIYHFSNEGVCSWYDFTKTIQSMAGNNGCRVVPCFSAQFPSKVKRPAYSVLDKSKYKEVFKREVPYWVDSLGQCVANLQAQN